MPDLYINLSSYTNLDTAMKAKKEIDGLKTAHEHSGDTNESQHSEIDAILVVHYQYSSEKSKPIDIQRTNRILCGKLYLWINQHETRHETTQHTAKDKYLLFNMIVDLYLLTESYDCYCVNAAETDDLTADCCLRNSPITTVCGVEG